jgi:hypothetical protein
MEYIVKPCFKTRRKKEDGGLETASIFWHFNKFDTKSTG